MNSQWSPDGFPMTPPWVFEIVHSCSGPGSKPRPVRVDTIQVSPSGLVKAKAVDRAGRPLESANQANTGAAPKPRWTCPTKTCGIDVAPSWSLFNELARSFREQGISRIELSELGAIVSKQKHPPELEGGI